jgi:hypothetical protein
VEPKCQRSLARCHAIQNQDVAIANMAKLVVIVCLDLLIASN